MVLNSKLFPNNWHRVALSFLTSINLISCGTGSKTEIIDNRLLVFVDQSASVSFNRLNNRLENIVAAKLNETYTHVKTPTVWYEANICTESNVVPVPYTFNLPFPDEDALGGVAFIEKEGEWYSTRNEWYKEATDKIKRSVDANKSGNTDVFSVLQTMEMIGKQLSEKDTLNVLIFSDLKHSVQGYELEDKLKTTDPVDLAKKEYARLAKEKHIEGLKNKFYCKMHVVTPDQFKTSGLITQFWETFLKEWGLPNAVTFE